MIALTLKQAWQQWFGIVVGFACLASVPAGAASVERMVKPANGVTRVVLEAPGELSIAPGQDEKVVIEAEPKVLARLEAVVKGDTLTLRAKESIRTDKGIRYTLTIRAFRGFDLASSGNAEVRGFSGTDMTVQISGSGNIEMNGIKSPNLTLKIPGSGNITASGEGAVLTAVIEGSGNIEADRYAARKADVRIDGSGGIRVRAEETLKAAIDGSGNIEYTGRAKVTKSITGAGNIDRM